MSIWGKIIGGAAGLALGGPLGALVGLAVGAAVDAGIDRTPATARSARHTREVTFTIGVIALAAKMAKADGMVTRAEVDAFKKVFKVPPAEMRNVGRVYDLARQHTAGFEAYARQIADLMQGNRPVLTDLLEALFFIAKADGEVHAAELAFIRSVADIFGFSPDEIETMIHRHLGPDPESPYTILGVTPMTDDATVKARYRQLVLETHPDRLMAEGVPADLIAVATRRAAEINAAYDEIMAARRKVRERGVV